MTTKPQRRDIVYLDGKPRTVVATYDFKNAVRIANNAGAERIVTAAELETYDDAQARIKAVRDRKVAKRVDECIHHVLEYDDGTRTQIEIASLLGWSTAKVRRYQRIITERQKKACQTSGGG